MIELKEYITFNGKKYKRVNEAFNPRRVDLIRAIEDMQDGQGPTGFKWVKQYAKKNKTIPDTVNHFLDKYKLRKYVYNGVSIN